MDERIMACVMMIITRIDDDVIKEVTAATIKKVKAATDAIKGELDVIKGEVDVIKEVKAATIFDALTIP